MERLKKVGDVKARNSSEIKSSPIGLGFENSIADSSTRKKPMTKSRSSV